MACHPVDSLFFSWFARAHLPCTTACSGCRLVAAPDQFMAYTSGGAHGYAMQVQVSRSPPSCPPDSEHELHDMYYPLNASSNFPFRIY